MQISTVFTFMIAAFATSAYATRVHCDCYNNQGRCLYTTCDSDTITNCQQCCGGNGEC
ncbi:unnamed protein product [Diplocarpon coronariae]